LVEGKVVYDGMSTILSASRQIYNASSTESEPGFCTYSFVFDVDQDGTTLSWAMHDDPDVALNSVKGVVNSSLSHLEAKTKKMNDILNDDVPYFRCSDDDIVKVYYFQYAIHAMYYTYIGKGQEQVPHVQSAVNNYLGQHNYDSVFQIRVGSWMANKTYFANGNVLHWAQLLDARKGEELPDNLGIDWNSGCYGGPSTTGHVYGAWTIYEHSGDLDFLK
jgi:hypothetical protein